jgi:hypothetical protein
MLSTSCVSEVEFNMHITIEAVLVWSPGGPIMDIGMLSTSCVSEVEFNMHITIEAVLAWSPGGPIMKASQCEFDRHIDMLSISCELDRHIGMLIFIL